MSFQLGAVLLMKKLWLNNQNVTIFETLCINTYKVNVSLIKRKREKTMISWQPYKKYNIIHLFYCQNDYSGFLNKCHTAQWTHINNQLSKLV